MSLTLVSTIAGEAANSYADVAYCDAYWEQHYDATKAAQWAALSATQKAALLIQACRFIEAVRFTAPNAPYSDSGIMRLGRHFYLSPPGNESLPVRAVSTQALQFPRYEDRDTAGVLFIPEGVLMAQCEQAVYLINFDETALANRLQGISTDDVQVGQIKMGQSYARGGTALAPMALEFLKAYLYKGSVGIRRA